MRNGISAARVEARGVIVASSRKVVIASIPVGAHSFEVPRAIILALNPVANVPFSIVEVLAALLTALPVFTALAAAVRHLLADPVLPPELLPADWPGARLRAAYTEYQSKLTERVRARTGRE